MVESLVFKTLGCSEDDLLIDFIHGFNYWDVLKLFALFILIGK